MYVCICILSICIYTYIQTSTRTHTNTHAHIPKHIKRIVLICTSLASGDVNDSVLSMNTTLKTWGRSVE